MTLNETRRTAARPNPTLLKIEDASKSYAGVRAVTGVSLELSRGEILALVGPNGAGKTTLLRMIIGMMKPDSGRIRYGFADALTPRCDPSRLGYLPEERGLYLDVPVKSVLQYFAVLRGMARKQAAAEAGRWLERLGLGDRATEEVRNLSKGNQQKVQFLTAVLHRPALAVLDEPFSGLDPLNQDVFLELIRELRDSGMTVLFSAHQMQLVERLADRVILINQGRFIASGTLDELRAGWPEASSLHDIYVRAVGESVAEVV